MAKPTKPLSKATYRKPPKFTPAEYAAVLQAMEDTAWIRPSSYADFMTAFVKLGRYVSSLP